MHRLLLIITLMTALASGGVLAADPLDEALVALEREQMKRLARQQNRPGARIDAFRTDGCSGGLSAAWEYLAEISPEFAARAGNLPPWENCCVEHDRHYWRGEAENGYEKRKQADAELRQCVILSGYEQQPELSRRLGLSPQEIEDSFNLVAEMMYQAVRLGGGPCTGLAWRWGHGWPNCAPLIEAESGN